LNLHRVFFFCLKVPFGKSDRKAFCFDTSFSVVFLIPHVKRFVPTLRDFHLSFFSVCGCWHLLPYPYSLVRGSGATVFLVQTSFPPLNQSFLARSLRSLDFAARKPLLSGSFPTIPGCLIRLRPPRTNYMCISAPFRFPQGRGLFPFSLLTLRLFFLELTLLGSLSKLPPRVNLFMSPISIVLLVGLRRLSICAFPTFNIMARGSLPPLSHSSRIFQ